MISVLFFYFFLIAFWIENVFGFKLTPIHGVSLLNLSIYLLLISWAIRVIKTRKLFEPAKVNKYLVLLFLVVLVSIPMKYLMNELPNLSLYEELVSLKGWLNPILVFFILYNVLDDEKQCRYAMGGLLVFLVVTIVSAIAVYTGGFELGKLKIAKERSAGFAEPNQFAAYLVLFVPLFISGLLFGGYRKKLFSVFIIFGVMISLFITGSRGGMISLLIAVLVYFYIFRALRLLRLWALILTLCFGIPLFGASAFFFAPEKARKTVMERFDPTKAKDTDEFTAGRISLWKNGFRLFLDSPVYGHGQATFIPLMKKNFRISGNSHNDYLLYLVHHGVIGLGLFLMVLWTLFRESWKIGVASERHGLKTLSLSYVSGFSGFVTAMFGVNIIQPLFLFWAYSAIILKYGRLALGPYTSAKK